MKMFTPSESKVAEDIEETPKRKSTFVAAAKRFVLSKSFSTSMGRSMLKSSLGPDGGQLLDALHAVFKHFSGSKGAEEVQRILMALVVRTKCAYEEEIFTRKDTFKAEMAVVASIKLLLETLQTPEKADLDKLRIYMSEVHVQCSRISNEFIASPETAQQLDFLFTYIKNESLLSCLILSPDIEEHREVLIKKIKKIATPLLKAASDRVRIDGFVRVSSETDTRPCHEDSKSSYIDSI
jgi:hypothetical protein